ncbi:MAG: hypothetical protein HQK55_08315 [Deltaproteobacteria bacterium]|nr:hypothetical protein [Deltaproteobacteria bacterium]
MYQFVTGPLLWLAFLVFFIGIIVRAVMYVRGLDWKMDRVAYRAYPKFAIRGALRSIFFWLVPFGTRNWQSKPWFTLLFFAFYFGFLLTPIFVLGHTVLLKERWGLPWPAMSNVIADGLSAMVIVTGLFLALRRIALPEVRIMTTLYDYLLIVMAIAPFVTGLIAAQGGPDARAWLILHVLTGEFWLAAIPFTKLSHMILFFMSRAQIGMDFGVKRGGMKGTDMAW